MFLQSGDICLMTRKARLSYHAVPRILPANPEELKHCFYGDDESCSNFGDGENVNKDLETENACKTNDSVDEDPYNVNGATENEDLVTGDKASKEFDNEPVIVNSTTKGEKCTVQELEKLMETVVNETDWASFQMYLNSSRVNVNVRQVLKEGFELGLAPDVIKPCQRTFANNKT